MTAPTSGLPAADSPASCLPHPESRIPSPGRRSPVAGRRPSVALISLGCPKNLVDSEVMLGLLHQAGYRMVPDPADAQAIIVNTCSFIEPAREEAREAIRGAARLRRRGGCRALVVAGCLPQRAGQRLWDEFPEIDALLGVSDFPRIAEIIGRALQGGHRRVAMLSRPTYLQDDQAPRVLSTPPWTAYLKLAEGCSHRCAFCAIPAIRGRYRSRPVESLVAEAARLAGGGVAELNLIAQDTTAYGIDLYRKPALPRLLRELAAVPGVRWLRVLYGFPSKVTGELIETIAELPQVCQYLDLPFQHADREILRRMRRPGDGASYLRLIERLRKRMPDIALRTSLVVGFPGEGEREFAELERFLDDARFDRAGVFAYSQEEGTSAARLPDQVPATIAEQRRRRLMMRQRKICRERNLRWVGRELEVLVESRGMAVPAMDQGRADSARKHHGRDGHATGGWIGRSFRDAPEVDGVVYLAAARLRPGQFVTARVTAAGDYDLEAELPS